MRPYTLKGYIKDDPHFTTLFENAVMLIGHFFEIAYCYNKLTGEETEIFEFYNDPTCTLVGKNNDWCLVGGDLLVLKIWIDNSLRKLDQLKDVFDLKSVDEYTVLILNDPWSEESAIWQLSIDLTKLTQPTALFKVRDFNDYIEKPYSDKVIW